tara:strand:- start:5398 stop:5655 length:258 start_codon:yes stop_codon:yes gene_type:complete
MDYIVTGDVPKLSKKEIDDIQKHYKKIKIRNNKHLYLKLGTPRYQFGTPEQIKEINKKLNNSLRVMEKRREFLKKTPPNLTRESK